jgi:hypothetical protein
MKAIIWFVALCGITSPCVASGLITLTNTQGRVYSDVHFVRTNEDGFIYSSAGSESAVGMIPYTSLTPADQSRFGISPGNLDLARKREQKRIASKREHLDKGEANLVERDLDNAIGAVLNEQRAAWGHILALRQQIADLESTVSARQNYIRHMSARVHDVNMANLYNPDAGTLYMKQEFIESVNDQRQVLNRLRENLQKMEAAYADKYMRSDRVSPPK